jgi:hypothetical protein
LIDGESRHICRYAWHKNAAETLNDYPICGLPIRAESRLRSTGG